MHSQNIFGRIGGETMTTKRILTGIRPTGALHLGHYVGALEQWLRLQDDYECFFLIADVQALTTHADQPELIERAVREVILDWIAVGLDPTRDNVHFVLQSGVPELTELTAYFTMQVKLSEVLRNPTVKAEQAQLEEQGRSITVGFASYPVSQAADILLFAPIPPGEDDELLVPVGEDQVPHLEATNRVARQFNRRYGRVFLDCSAKVGKVGRLPGTDGSGKMSKSVGNVIMLKDSAETVRKQVMSMYTDPKKLRKGDAGHPDDCPVYMYHQAFGSGAGLEKRAERCKAGDLGCVECKRDLVKVLNAFQEPIRVRRAEAEEEPLGDYLRSGTERAREVGGATMEAVREAMHLNYPSVFSH